MQIKPVVVFRRQSEEGFFESLLDTLEDVPAGLLLLGGLLQRDYVPQLCFDALQSAPERFETFIVNHPGAGPRGELEKRRVDHSLQETAVPRINVQRVDLRDRGNDSGARTKQTDVVVRSMTVQIQFERNLSAPRRDTSKFMEQPSRELARLHLELLLGRTIKNVIRTPDLRMRSRSSAAR